MKKLSWCVQIPLYKATYIWRSVFIGWLGVVIAFSLIISIIFVADGDGGKLLEVAPTFFLGFILFYLALVLGAWIALGSRYALRYLINEKGLKITGTRDKAKDIRKLAIMAGVLSANPGLVGGGLLVRKDVIHVPWEEIKSLEIDPEMNRIAVKCSFLKQVDLHFPEDKEQEVLQVFENYSSKILNNEEVS